MKSNLKLFVFILILCLFLPRSSAGEEAPFTDSDAVISMDFQEASLKDILKILSIQSGLNFIASADVQDRKITLYLDKVPVRGVMDRLFKANNLVYELDADSNTFIIKEEGVSKRETVTKIFFLKYATVSSSALKACSAKSSTGASASGSSSSGITQAAEKLLTEDGSIIEDSRTNSLIVTDVPKNIPIIGQFIASLDIPTSQVMLEVEMLDVSKKLVDHLGFKFGSEGSGINPFTLIIPGGFGSGTNFFVGKKGYINKEGAVTLGTTYAQMLDFIRTDTHTKTLARPRLLTLNNESAEIRIITDEVIGEKITYNPTTGVKTDSSAERTETGVFLKVTPQIDLETGEITMSLNPSVREANASIFSGYRDPEERSTKSIVRVKDGDTVIVGGLIRNEFEETNDKLPILSDIPFLGALFRHKSKAKDIQRELLVFITPHIIKEKNIKITGVENRDSLFDRQVAVNSSLSSFEKMWK